MLPVWFIIQGNSAPFTNPNFLDKLANARTKFELYGLKDEIEVFERFVSAIESQNLVAANSTLSGLLPTVRSESAWSRQSNPERRRMPIAAARTRSSSRRGRSYPCSHPPQ